jgi:phosphomannomutase
MEREALLALTRAWIAGDPDVATRGELEALVSAGALEELRARMLPPLAFGTAGLRAPVGAGAARMNRAVVIRTTRGVADFLTQHRSDARALPVVVGCDARTTSGEFLRDVVAVLGGARVPVRYFEEPVPTPLVAYVARALAATAAIVVTASHNPREDNGYKLYLDDAVQLTAPHDRAIEAAIDRVGAAADVPYLAPPANALAPTPFQSEMQPLDAGAWLERYLTEVLALLGPHAPGELRIAYTPLHGVGRRFALRAFERAGFTDVRVVPEQGEPDGSFPTTPFPNPEEPETLRLGLEFAAEQGADVLIANDPDADRLAVAVPTPSGRWQRLTGNQLAALLADARLPQAAPGAARSATPIVTTSIVTTPLVEAIAASRGARVERTHTGFKWLWTAALALERAGEGRFAYACEEALGYSLTPAVRDKDGIAAAVAVAELAARCRQRGKSLIDRLHELYAEFGIWASAQVNVAVPARPVAEAVSGALDRAASGAITTLGRRAVERVVDYRIDGALRPRWLGAAPLVELVLAGGRVLVRPSGTEPKLKIYVDLRAEPRAGVASGASEAALAVEARELGESLVAKLGLLGEDAGA